MHFRQWEVHYDSCKMLYYQMFLLILNIFRRFLQFNFYLRRLSKFWNTENINLG